MESLSQKRGASASFKTMGVPAVNNGIGPSGVGFTSAILNGNLTTGGQARVYVYWGTDTNNWASTNDFGFLADGAFSTNISGLSPTTLYYYRCQATNQYGDAWSESTNFTTFTIGAYFVTPTGAGAKTGATWENALDSIQSAVNIATAVNDVVYLKYGSYSNGVQLNISGKPGMTISGGYAGSGSPGPFTNAPSILTRTNGASTRIVYASGSTATLERVTIQGGYVLNGAGLYLLNSAMTLKDCGVLTNVSGGGGDAPTFGGGIYASGGSLTIAGGVFSNNYVAGGDHLWGNLNPVYGGAIYASSIVLSLTNCVFNGNYVSGSGNGSRVPGYGGGLCLTGGSASLIGCLFTNANRVSVDGSAWGGAVYAAGVNLLLIDNCQVFGSYASYGMNSQGGAMYLIGTTQRVVITRSEFRTNGTTYVGDIYVVNGSVAMSNVLCACNRGDGIRVNAGTVTVVNCTLAANTGWGLTNASGAVTVKNTIVWNNGLGGIMNATAVTYTDSQEAQAGVGNISTNPLFVAAASGDYHEMSRGGAWRADLGQFVPNRLNSPCVDAGDPADDYSREPSPNGKRINMGAFGNTAYASKTAPKGTMIVIF